MREFVLRPDLSREISTGDWIEGLAWGLDIEVTRDDRALATDSRPSRSPERWLRIAMAADALRARWGCPPRFVVVTDSVTTCP